MNTIFTVQNENAPEDMASRGSYNSPITPLWTHRKSHPCSLWWSGMLSLSLPVNFVWREDLRVRNSLKSKAFVAISKEEGAGNNTCASGEFLDS